MTYKITTSFVNFAHSSMWINWSARGIGHGVIQIMERDGVAMIYSDNTSKEFIKMVLADVVDHALLEHEMGKKGENA